MCQSLVLLKNNRRTLPIRANARVLVAGAAAVDIGQASGGWTLTGRASPAPTSISPTANRYGMGCAKLSKPAVVLLNLASMALTRRGLTWRSSYSVKPYAEFQGDIENLDFAQRAVEMLRRFRAARIPQFQCSSPGRPLWTNPEINASDAFVAAWLPGSEGAGVADVLIGDARGRARHDFRGTLSFSWPRTAGADPLNRGEPGYNPQFAYGTVLPIGTAAA